MASFKLDSGTIVINMFRKSCLMLLSYDNNENNRTKRWLNNGSKNVGKRQFCINKKSFENEILRK